MNSWINTIISKQKEKEKNTADYFKVQFWNSNRWKYSTEPAKGNKQAKNSGFEALLCITDAVQETMLQPLQK